MNLLVGDIGGTHCRLALARIGACPVELHAVQHYTHAGHDSLAAILRAYLDTCRGARPGHACLAVAGPTDGQQVRFTNLDWQLGAAELAQDTGLGRVHLINDFLAVGWGLQALGADQLHPLQTGRPDPHASRLALGAGTGLGVTVVCRQADGWRPQATEGGHIGLAPANAEQDRLLEFLRREHGRVSVERVLSGPGIEALYRFSAREAGQPEAPRPDCTAQAISHAALHRQDAIALHAMRLFARILGQVAGDAALLTGARGGVYLAGGIAPRNLPILQGPEFLAGLHDKGRFAAWSRDLPVAVILDADIGLRGAALAALHAPGA